MSFFSWISKLTNSGAITKEAKILYEEIGEQRINIKSLLSELQIQELWRKEYTGALGNLTEAMDSCVWKKNQNHKYILANSIHCKYFFGFDASPECLEVILGKSDSELIQEYYHKKNIQNTFGDLCGASDMHIATKKAPTHYLEAGLIDGQEILLYCVKIPWFKKGEFRGTMGIGWDFSDQSKFVITLLNRWIYDGKVTELYRSDESFCYHVHPEDHQCQVFQHICPYPQHRKDTLLGEMLESN